MQMLTSSNATRRIERPLEDRLGEIRTHIACAMIGKTVSLMADARTVARGMVAGIMVETGIPKIVVNGHGYQLNQILSVTPVSALTTN